MGIILDLDADGIAGGTAVCGCPCALPDSKAVALHGYLPYTPVHFEECPEHDATTCFICTKQAERGH